MSIAILFSLVSLIFIFYGDWLIIKYKIEEKFPRLAKFIQLPWEEENSKNTIYPLCGLLNASIMAAALLLIIYVNLVVLLY
jgi:hypothetical protein